MKDKPELKMTDESAVRLVLYFHDGIEPEEVTIKKVHEHYGKPASSLYIHYRVANILYLLTVDARRGIKDFYD